MIKPQNPLPSSLRVPIQHAQSDTSLLACLLDDDRYDVDVSGFSQVLDPDWVSGSGAIRFLSHHGHCHGGQVQQRGFGHATMSARDWTD